MPAVLIRIGEARECPVLLHEEHEPLTGGNGVRWRLVAHTDDCREATSIIEELRRLLEAGELL